MLVRRFKILIEADAQLRALPFDRLKIDRSFVLEIAHNGGRSKLVKAII
ncbi:EAL domain-containing protein [Altericroceibacterium spongiae]|uniref:EAL domain-containing protein n=2 Tax=Altericroceibacterium spongiae TaxID=2320269 RepID=A0A420EMP8_9SPHN|nr:EAL domain-containing protein [Altericroceibacterium spongiae]